MLDISKLSNSCEVRALGDSNAGDILALCVENTQYYQYCGKQPTMELIRRDLHITPPGIEASAKYYLGFYEGETLVAVMDLIDGYPSAENGYIDFFMMNKHLQGKQIGTMIVQGVCAYLKSIGKTSVQLGIDKGNPQSTHFWKKNGFRVIREIEADGWTILYAEKRLDE